MTEAAAPMARLIGVADATYGTNVHLRTALSERGVYVLAVRSDASAHPFEAKPVEPARNDAIDC